MDYDADIYVKPVHSFAHNGRMRLCRLQAVHVGITGSNTLSTAGRRLCRRHRICGDDTRDQGHNQRKRYPDCRKADKLVKILDKFMNNR